MKKSISLSAPQIEGLLAAIAHGDDHGSLMRLTYRNLARLRTRITERPTLVTIPDDFAAEQARWAGQTGIDGPRREHF